MRVVVLNLVLCYFVLVFFSPLSIGITSLGEERANLSAFHTFVRYAFVWFVFPLPLCVWDELRVVIVPPPGLFSYRFFFFFFFFFFGQRTRDVSLLEDRTCALKDRFDRKPEEFFLSLRGSYVLV